MSDGSAKPQQAMFLCMSQTDAYQCLLLNEMLCNILHDLPCYNTASGAQAAGSPPLPRSAHTPSYCYSVYEQATDTHTHTQRYTKFIKHAQYRDYPGLKTFPSLNSTSAEHSSQAEGVKPRESHDAAGATTTQDWGFRMYGMLRVKKTTRGEILFLFGSR